MKKISKRFLSALLLITSAAFVLSGCSHPKPNPLTPRQQQLLTLRQSIQQDGVQIIKQGARVQLVIPVDTFFHLASTQLLDYKTDTVQRIALFLQIYLQQFSQPVMIHVSGYSDTVYPSAKRIPLSNQYAQVIASFLWNHGFSHKQLHIVGFGSLHPIGNNKTTRGSGYNRRVMVQVN